MSQVPTQLSSGRAVSQTSWFVRRAIIGLIILVATVSAGALLMHASIDPVEDTQERLIQRGAAD